MKIKSFKFSEILRPSIGLIDPGPLTRVKVNPGQGNPGSSFEQLW